MSLRMVPPQPISMSSEWAPTASSRAGRGLGPPITKRSIRRIPPRRRKERPFHSCHGACPDSCRFSSHCWSLSVSMGDQKPSCRWASTWSPRHQPVQRLLDEVLAGTQAVEELGPHDEVTAVDPDVGAGDVAHARGRDRPRSWTRRGSCSSDARRGSSRSRRPPSSRRSSPEDPSRSACPRSSRGTSRRPRGDGGRRAASPRWTTEGRCRRT